MAKSNMDVVLDCNVVAHGADASVVERPPVPGREACREDEFGGEQCEL